MRLDFVNPASLMPSQPTETGAPAIPQPIQLGDIAPAFNLPEDGSKPSSFHIRLTSSTGTAAAPVTANRKLERSYSLRFGCANSEQSGDRR